MNWFKQAQFTNIISLQEAIDKNMFGPVYHGTSSTNKEKIDQEGFKIFVGDSRTGDISHGYEGAPYDIYGDPAPVHHLGFGVYFTTVKNIAKDFNYGTGRGLDMYYLDVPKLETINFGSPNTMMKWWKQNGYDPQLAGTDRVAATVNLTNTLKSKYDAVWFKGKGIRKLLDGDQVCVYDPSRIYRIDKKLAQPGQIGSKVVRKIDGMKGTLVARRPLPPDVSQQYHHGEPEFLTVKWQKGGTDYNVYPSQVDFQ